MGVKRAGVGPGTQSELFRSLVAGHDYNKCTVIQYAFTVNTSVQLLTYLLTYLLLRLMCPVSDSTARGIYSRAHLRFNGLESAGSTPLSRGLSYVCDRFHFSPVVIVLFSLFLRMVYTSEEW